MSIPVPREIDGLVTWFIETIWSADTGRMPSKSKIVAGLVRLKALRRVIHAKRRRRRCRSSAASQSSSTQGRRSRPCRRSSAIAPGGPSAPNRTPRGSEDDAVVALQEFRRHARTQMVHVGVRRHAEIDAVEGADSRASFQRSSIEGAWSPEEDVDDRLLVCRDEKSVVAEIRDLERRLLSFSRAPDDSARSL